MLEQLEEAIEENVSRETMTRLLTFEKILVDWNKKVNLLATAECEKIWERHILNCAHLYPHVKGKQRVMDIGTGAGFPGMVLAILGVDMVLVEANRKKSIFLKQVSRLVKVNVVVLNKRVESIEQDNIDTVVSRGVASLTKLLKLTYPLIRDKGKGFFMKGDNVESELTEAEQQWNFKYKQYPNQKGVILEIKELMAKR